jgi:uncharacterized membrane protein
MIKKSAIIVLCLQIISLLSYFTTLVTWLNPSNYVLFPLWFLIGIAGIVQSFFMFIKKKLFPLAIIMLFLSLVIIFIGGLMLLFLTM